MPTGMQGLIGNPYVALGMGLLGGNTGRTGDQAFANAMRSGLQAMNQSAQFGLLSQMQDLQRQQIEQEIRKEDEERERKRRLRETMGSMAYKGATPEERRDILGSAFPEMAAKSLLDTPPEYLEYLKAKSASLLSEKPAAPKAPISLMDPRSFQQVSLRPDDPKVDDLLSQGFVRVGLGLQGTTPSDIFPGTESQMGQAVQQIGFYEDLTTEMDRWIAAIESDPSLVGPVGGMRSAGQTMLGVTEDLTAIVSPQFANNLKAFTDEALSRGVASDMPTEERQRLFTDPRLSRRELFENRLGLALARMQYGEGRIPVEVIRRSIKDAKMTGLTSSRQVLSRIKDIRGRVSSNIEQLNWRLQGGSSGRVEGRAQHPETKEPMVKIGGTWYSETEARQKGLLR